MRTEDLEFELPPAQIAQAPLPDRDGARLLLLDRGAITDERVRSLPSLLPPSLFVVNDTRVIPARLFGHKPSGGKVELLLVERLETRGASEELWHAMGRSSKGLKVGASLLFDGLQAEVRAKRDDGTIEVLLSAQNVTSRIDAIGAMPLPPYIRRDAEAADAARYQTIFAKEAGAVAAPTAGLHFSSALLEALQAARHELTSVTLHVGPGTFRPVKADNLDSHPMHEERFVVPETCAHAIARARRDQRPIVAVGTTVVRTLESVGDAEGNVAPGSGRTKLFIKPPYKPKVVDHVMTNFHLPRSTLLALTMALGGQTQVREAYRHAVASGYRFFSYGDAMLLRNVSDR